MGRWSGLGLWGVLMMGMVAALPAGRVGAADEAAARLDDLVVTATRTQSRLDKVGGSSVTVITAEDIRAGGHLTVREALKAVPGLDIVASGGLGAQSSVFLRGADSKNTLVMIDGIMINDPSSTNRVADLGHLTLDNVERIEVVRGPQSVLYGSNATAGVINIITRQGSGAPHVHAGAEGGSFNTRRLYGGANGRRGPFRFAFSAARLDSDGFSVADADNDRIPQSGNTDEDDGYRNRTLSGRFGLDVTPDFALDLSVRHLDAEVQFDDYNFAGYAQDNNAGPGQPTGAKDRSDQTYLRIEARNHFFERFFETRVYTQQAIQDHASYDNDGVVSSDFSGDARETGAQGNLNFANDIVSFGATYFHEAYESAGTGEKAARTRSHWAQNQFFWNDALELIAGFRTDDHATFGRQTTYRFSSAYTFKDSGTTVKATYGTGYRAPSLYELYADQNPSWWFLGGNAALKPETSKAWDAGVEQALFGGTLSVGATYFESRYEDRIAYITDPLTFQSTYQNAAGITRTQGVESFMAWAPQEHFSCRLDYSYIHALDHNEERQVRRPMKKVGFNARYRPIDPLSLNLDVQWADARDASTFAFDRYGDRVRELDPYTVVNVSARYQVCRSLEVYGRVENLFDEYYEEAWSYATAGLSAYAGIRVSY